MKKSIILFVVLTCLSFYSEGQNNYMMVIVNITTTEKTSQINIIDESDQLETISIQPLSSTSQEKFMNAQVENAKIVNRVLSETEKKGYELVDVNTVQYGTAVATTTYLYKKRE